MAFDPRPIFGGKLLIQANRYKNTMSVGILVFVYGGLAVALLQGARWMAAGRPAPRRPRRRRRMSR